MPDIDAPNGAWKTEVVASPHDPAIASRFFAAYEKRPAAADEELRAIYLQLKYFHDPDKARWLGVLGGFFRETGRPYLAALCFLESVRLRPDRPEIYREYERVRDRLEPAPYRGESGPGPKVSVIMATYDRGEGILESVRSVLGQTEQDFELIVVDDGGKGCVEALLRGLGSPKIRCCRLPENRGHAAALNEGIRRARGRYVAYLDDDDVYYPNHLEALLGTLRERGRAFAYSDTKMVSGGTVDGRFRADGVKGTWNFDFSRDMLVAGNFIANLTVVHERSVFSEVGLFAEELRVVMDWELWLRAALSYDFARLPEYTGEYRLRSDNITARDRLRIDFHTELVKAYYVHHRGAVAEVRYRSWKGDEEAARDGYSGIRNRYKAYFHSPDSFDELLELAARYGDDAFAREMAVDYFRLNTRRFLKYVYRTGRYGLLVPVSRLMPGKVADAARKRLGKAGTR